MVATFLLVVVPIVVALGLVRKYQEHTWGKFKSETPLNGKVFLITGSNSGIGKETARELAKRNACVIMACRDVNKAKLAINDIRKTTSSGELIPMYLDMASFESIKKFCKEVLEKFTKINVLINNAGVYFPLTNTLTTKEGFEMNFGVNHLGHFLLTKLLIERIKQSAPSRIVIVSSLLHEKGQIDFDDLNMEKRRKLSINSRLNPAYCASKLANVYHCRELSKKLKNTGVNVYAVCPGFTYTGLFRYSSFKWWQYILFSPVALLYLRSPWQGAQTILHCACKDNVQADSGSFFRNCQLYNSKKVLNPTVQAQLWEKSEELINQAIKL